jgi:hypothetical protein
MQTPSVIAFGYYDGVTEGIARRAFGGADCYFKVIAWDGGQDDRLFAAVEVSAQDYLSVASLLGKGQRTSSHDTWVPEWVFSSEEDRHEMEVILKKFKDDVVRKGVLLFAEGIGQKEALRVEIDPAMAARVTEALHKEAPGDLAQWIGQR